MRSTARSARLVATIVTVVLLLGACRSDGGIGRRDALRGMRWTLDTLSTQAARDVESTAHNVDDLADWFDYEVTHPTEQMRRTMNMYLEGNARR